MEKLEIVLKNPNDLTPWCNNSKIHSDEQVAKLADQIANFGFDQPIVVDRNNVIIKGHGRRLAALKIGLTAVPVIISELNETQAMAVRIADNKVAEAPWDPSLLKMDIETLKIRGFELGLTAIDPAQVDFLLDPITADGVFSESEQQSVQEREEAYEQSGVRQIILVTDPVTFTSLMVQFSDLQRSFGVDTNIEIIQKLIGFYKEHA